MSPSIKCWSSNRGVRFRVGLGRLLWVGAGEDSHVRLRFVAQRGVEQFGFCFFDLCFNVRDAALRAKFVYGL